MSSPIDISQLTFNELRDYALSLEEDLGEITETWTPLPVDRDGALLHVGDYVIGVEADQPTIFDPIVFVVKGYGVLNEVILQEVDTTKSFVVGFLFRSRAQKYKKHTINKLVDHGKK